MVVASAQTTMRSPEQLSFPSKSLQNPALNKLWKEGYRTARRASPTSSSNSYDNAHKDVSRNPHNESSRNPHSAKLKDHPVGDPLSRLGPSASDSGQTETSYPTTFPTARYLKSISPQEVTDFSHAFSLSETEKQRQKNRKPSYCAQNDQHCKLQNSELWQKMKRRSEEEAYTGMGKQDMMPARGSGSAVKDQHNYTNKSHYDDPTTKSNDSTSKPRSMASTMQEQRINDQIRTEQQHLDSAKSSSDQRIRNSVKERTTSTPKLTPRQIGRDIPQTGHGSLSPSPKSNGPSKHSTRSNAQNSTRANVARMTVQHASSTAPYGKNGTDVIQRGYQTINFPPRRVAVDSPEHPATGSTNHIQVGTDQHPIHTNDSTGTNSYSNRYAKNSGGSASRDGQLCARNSGNNQTNHNRTSNVSSHARQRRPSGPVIPKGNSARNYMEKISRRSTEQTDSQVHEPEVQPVQETIESPYYEDTKVGRNPSVYSQISPSKFGTPERGHVVNPGIPPGGRQLKNIHRILSSAGRMDSVARRDSAGHRNSLGSRDSTGHRNSTGRRDSGGRWDSLENSAMATSRTAFSSHVEPKVLDPELSLVAPNGFSRTTPRGFPNYCDDRQRTAQRDRSAWQYDRNTMHENPMGHRNNFDCRYLKPCLKKDSDARPLKDTCDHRSKDSNATQYPPNQRESERAYQGGPSTSRPKSIQNQRTTSVESNGGSDDASNRPTSKSNSGNTVSDCGSGSDVYVQATPRTSSRYMKKQRLKTRKILEKYSKEKKPIRKKDLIKEFVKTQGRKLASILTSTNDAIQLIQDCDEFNALQMKAAEKGDAHAAPRDNENSTSSAKAGLRSGATADDDQSNHSDASRNKPRLVDEQLLYRAKQRLFVATESLKDLDEEMDCDQDDLYRLLTSVEKQGKRLEKDIRATLDLLMADEEVVAYTDKKNQLLRNSLNMFKRDTETTHLHECVVAASNFNSNVKKGYMKVKESLIIEAEDLLQAVGANHSRLSEVTSHRMSFSENISSRLSRISEVPSGSRPSEDLSRIPEIPSGRPSRYSQNLPSDSRRTSQSGPSDNCSHRSSQARVSYGPDGVHVFDPIQARESVVLDQLRYQIRTVDDTDEGELSLNDSILPRYKRKVFLKRKLTSLYKFAINMLNTEPASEVPRIEMFLQLEIDALSKQYQDLI